MLEIKRKYFLAEISLTLRSGLAILHVFNAHLGDILEFLHKLELRHFEVIGVGPRVQIVQD